MTNNEMDEYLESIGGINRTYRDFMGPITNSKAFGVGNGWFPLLKKLIEELIVLGWDKRLVQCKEKFGGLRFYVETAPEGGFDVIRKYEELSNITCEQCGEPGSPRKGSWISTFCDKHSNGREKI